MEEQKNTIIAIGRQFGSGGRAVGKKVAEILHIPYYDKELLAVAAKDSGLCSEFLEEFDEKPNRSRIYSALPQAGFRSFGRQSKTVEEMAYEAQRDALRKVADESPCVIVGRSADYVLKRTHDVVSIFISADFDERVKHVMERDHLTEAEAEKRIRRADKARASYYNGYTDSRWGEAASYELCLRNGGYLRSDDLAWFIVEYVKRRNSR